MPIFLFSEIKLITIIPYNRLFPPVPVDPKVAINDDVLPNGHKIPAGVREFLKTSFPRATMLTFPRHQWYGPPM